MENIRELDGLLLSRIKIVPTSLKIFLDDGVVIRHINQIPISLGVSDKEVIGSIANTKVLKWQRHFLSAMNLFM